jgi:Protein of unknown function (DUF1573)
MTVGTLRYTAGLGLALVALSIGARAEDAPGVPKMKVLKLEHNAGQLEPGPQYDYTFPIRNEGTAPLEIRRAEADCMCVVPAFDRVIPPGGTGAVRIRFNTRGRIGIMLKHVTVETNDPAQPQVVLTLSAMLRLPVEVSPSEEIMLPLPAGEATTTEITLHATQGRTLELGPIRASQPGIRVRALSRKQVAERIPADVARTQILQVTIPTALAGKAFDAMLTISTNSARRPSVVVRLHGYPRTAVDARPTRLYFGEVKAEKSAPLLRLIALFRRQGGFKVLGAEASDKDLRLQISQERSDYWEVLAVYEGGWPKGVHEGVITIRTDDPLRPVVRVPYRADVS